MARNAGNTEVYPVVAYSYGRLSGTKQEEGTGQERQMELMREWCQRKGIPLDERLSYFDKASGFHGHHRRKGAGLYLFLQACEQKRVRQGSYLLVESLDRLSREQLQEGQALIKRLLFDYRVRLIVLFTGMEYNAENYQQTHWSIDAEFDRAYSESFNKSVRSKDNWMRRRRAAMETGATLTRKIPTWLKITDGKPVEDPTKTPTVRRIFALAVKGYGFAGIAGVLNKEGVKPFGRGRFWRDSVVEKIIKSRATLGEYQPHHLKDGKREPAGPVLEGYFPVIVSADQWRTAHAAIKSRQIARVRATPRVANLFTGLVYDESGYAMAYTSKAGNGYLQTGKKDTPGIRYSFFERALLHWLREVEVRLDNTADVSALRVRAEKLAGDIKTMKAKIDAYPDDLADMLDTLAQMRRDHAAIVAEIEAACVPLQTQFAQAQRVAEALATATGEARDTLRREVRQAVRMAVVRINVTLRGDKYGGKHVEAWVTFRDGSERGVYYKTQSGRLIEGGLMSAGSQEIRKTLRLMRDTPAFPTDAAPAAAIKAKCKAMRASGKSYRDIEAETGLHRVTIYRYVKDRR